MPSHAPSAPMPVPATALGAALLAAFWAAALLGPAAFVAGTAWALLDFGPGAAPSLGLAGLGSTILAFGRVAGRPGLWRGM